MTPLEPAAERWRVCVAPMMDWTDRHCRYFLRLLAPRTRLYTEMVVANAIVRGDRAKLLGFDASNTRSRSSSAAPTRRCSRRRPRSASSGATTRST
jgi:tRNA-dihydrouridine synthase